MDRRTDNRRPVYRVRRGGVIAGAASRVAMHPFPVRATVEGEAFLNN
jgi:hypothetical protein